MNMADASDRDTMRSQGSAARAFVRADGLAKAYGGFAAVQGVSFQVPAGQTLALLGPSGCGKTTILRCLAGLEVPERGTIAIGDKTVFDAAGRVNLMPEQRELGVVFQSYAVWPHMTVAENVGFPLKVRGVGGAAIAEAVDAILGMVGLARWRDRSAMALSGGQQQRVALARALVHRPQLVLFDEPMSNLDTQLREQMRVELKLLQEKLAFTAVYVTHDQSEAFALAQTVAVLNHGRIEMLGSPRDVFRRPETPFVAEFFGYNVVEGTVAGLESGAALVECRGVRLWGTVHRPLQVGDRAAFCVRREHVTLSNTLNPGPTAELFPATVRAVSFQGLIDEYVVAIGDVELRGSGPSAGAAPGSATVHLDRRDCIVLPAG
jgi:iron(III) transport system ATP-binding protein